MDSSLFSWTDFYTELANRVLEYKDNRRIV